MSTRRRLITSMHTGKERQSSFHTKLISPEVGWDGRGISCRGGFVFYHLLRTAPPPAQHAPRTRTAPRYATHALPARRGREGRSEHKYISTAWQKKKKEKKRKRRANRLTYSQLSHYHMEKHSIALGIGKFYLHSLILYLAAGMKTRRADQHQEEDRQHLTRRAAACCTLYRTALPLLYRSSIHAGVSRV